MTLKELKEMGAARTNDDLDKIRLLLGQIGAAGANKFLLDLAMAVRQGRGKLFDDLSYLQMCMPLIMYSALVTLTPLCFELIENKQAQKEANNAQH